MDLEQFHLHNKGKRQYRDWLQGFETPVCKKTNYVAMLQPREENIAKRTQEYLDHCDDLDRRFQRETCLTPLDIRFLIVAACMQTLRWGLLNNTVGRFANSKDGEKFIEGTKQYLPASMEQLVMDHRVPYDVVARSERFRKIYGDESTGLSGNTHRVRALGHDPLAGLIFGTANIATNTVTVNDWSQIFPSYHVVNGEIDAKTDVANVLEWTGQMMVDKPEIVGASFIKQIIHCGTDVFTKQGLPIPVINIISPEVSQFLIGKGIDLYSVTRSATLTILINKFIEMCHRLFFRYGHDDARTYEVRTRKILLYSNTFSSVLNMGYAYLKRDIKYLDVGGLLVTLWRLLTDSKRISELRAQFIQETLDGELKKEEDAARDRLARLGVFV